MIDFKFITEPYSFQYEVWKKGIENNSLGLLLDLGLGKTKCSIDIMRYRIQQGQVNRVLVICPTSILYNWDKEVKLHSEYSPIVLHGLRESRLQKFRQKNNYQFFIINYEALHLFFEEILKLKADGIIFDESARYIKNIGAKRTKAAIKLADITPYRLLLTATPIANRPLDVWSQLRILDGGKTLGRNFYKYRNLFFRKVLVGRGRRWPKWIFKSQYSKALNEAIFSCCIMKSKKECIDLPKQIFNKYELQMPYELEKIYRKIQSEVLGEIRTLEGSAQFRVNNILTKLLRLQQVTSGFIRDEVSGAIQELELKPKLDALIEQIQIILDAEESVIVWCRFLHSIDMIKERLENERIKCITMSGQDKNKYIKWKTFQKSKEIKVFIGQIESGGLGIELFKENSTNKNQYMIFYENTWSLDVRQQATGRIHRIGQKSHCVYIDLIMKNTIDEKILKTLEGNKKVADMILKYGANGFLK